MRLIGTFYSPEEAHFFSSFLAEQGIENTLEVTKESKWDSDNYGTVSYKIWVHEEDQKDTALDLTEKYQNNKNDLVFLEHQKKYPTPPPFSPPKRQTTITQRSPKKKPSSPFIPTPLGWITRYLLILCLTLFIYGYLTSPYKNLPHPILDTFIYTSPIKKTLFYDYPKAYEILEDINPEDFHKLAEMSPQDREIFEKYFKTPSWKGFYEKSITFLTHPRQLKFEASLFEKIRKGEVWRLFTPCLLHVDLLHLFFNMIWLFILGKQIEERIFSFRYLLFILSAGIFSNTAQYLMSGPNFIGFSGVLCAMITFIWFRKQKNPREGYQLLPATMAFVSVLVLGMAAVQMIAFFTEIAGNTPFSFGIANTAHLSGAFFGFLCSQMPFFASKK